MRARKAGVCGARRVRRRRGLGSPWRRRALAAPAGRQPVAAAGPQVTARRGRSRASSVKSAP